MWVPWSEIDKFGGIKCLGPRKAYIKCQNIEKRSETSSTSILRFSSFFLRGNATPKLTCHGSRCEKSINLAAINFLRQARLYQVSKHRKTFWNEFYIGSYVFSCYVWGTKPRNRPSASSTERSCENERVPSRDSTLTSTKTHAISACSTFTP